MFKPVFDTDSFDVPPPGFVIIHCVDVFEIVSEAPVIFPLYEQVYSALMVSELGVVFPFCLVLSLIEFSVK